MKKPIVIMMLFVYTVLTVGMTIIVHTCGGETDTIIAISTVEDPCGCDDATTSEVMDKCCTAEVKTAKLDDAQKVSVATIVEKLIVVGQVHTPLFFALLNNDSNQNFQFAPAVSPPPNTDLNIVNSVFLI
jgi:hypothetical protein